MGWGACDVVVWGVGGGGDGIIQKVIDTIKYIRNYDIRNVGVQRCGTSFTLTVRESSDVRREDK